MSETTRIEYKEILTKELDIEKEVIAFLNYKEGGYEEFFSGISIPRNKELMRIYRDVELVESLGSGIPRILRAYGEECFKFTDNFIRITFPVSGQGKSGEKTTQKTTQKATQKTAQKTAQKILHYIKQDASISRNKLAELCGISPDGIKWQLNKMQKNGVIRRVGPNKGGYWEVIEQNNNNK